MIDYENVEKYNVDTVDKQLTIHIERGGNLDDIYITNEDICSEYFELTESISSTNTIVIGSCEASVLNVRIANINSKLKGFWLTVDEVLGGDTAHVFRYGRYMIDSDKPTADRIWRDIVAYDAMYEVLNTDVTNWYKSFFETHTNPKLSDFITDFLGVRFSHLFGNGKIKYPKTGLVNKDIAVTQTLSTDSPILGKTIINGICEVNGCFGRINRQGYFEFVYLPPLSDALFPSETLYPADDLYPKDSVDYTIGTNYYSGTCQYEDFLTQKIDGVLLVKKDANNDIKIYSGSSQSLNTYTITNNIFVIDKSDEEMSTIAQNILNKISVIEYTPLEIQCNGNPCIECGDNIRVFANYDTVDTYVLSRTITGIQAKTDYYISSGTEYIEQESNASNVQNMIFDTVRNATKDLSDYQKQALNNTKLMAQAIGYYSTVETDEQGRTTTYWHNKPNKDDSTVIWKFTVDGVFIWTADDPYYTNAFLSDGTLTTKTIYAMGVSADFIKGGSLEIGGTGFNKDGQILVKDASGNLLIKIDKNGMVLSMGQKISWNNLSDVPTDIVREQEIIDFVTEEEALEAVKQLDVTDLQNNNNALWSTQIGDTWLATTNVYAQNVRAGKVYAQDIDTSTAKIETAQIENLVVGDNVTMGENARISWGQVDDQPDITAWSNIQNVYCYRRKGYIVSAPQIYVEGSPELVAENIWTKSIPKLPESDKQVWQIYTCMQIKKDASRFFNTEIEEYVPNEWTTYISKNAITTEFLNARNITASAVVSDWVYAGNIIADQIDVSQGKITADQIEVSELEVKSALTADKVYAENIDTTNALISTAQIEDLVVGGNVTMGESATISWGNVDGTDGVVTDLNKTTKIGKDYIETLNIKAGSVDAENISGSTITGKNIVIQQKVHNTYGDDAYANMNDKYVGIKSSGGNNYISMSYGWDSIVGSSKAFEYGSLHIGNTQGKAFDINYSKLDTDYNMNFSGLVTLGYDVVCSHPYARAFTNYSNAVMSTTSHYLGVASGSSKRWKHDIEEFDVSEIEKLYDMPVVKFKYNNDYLDSEDERYDTSMYGFISEYIEEALPIAVNHDEDGNCTMWNSNIIVPCMMKLIQDQKKEIDSLKDELTELKELLKEKGVI